MLKKKQIFVGKVKKCRNYDIYMRGKDESIDNVENINSYAVLIKVGNKRYIWVNMLNFFEGFMVNMGYEIKVLGNYPKKDGDLFVDDSDLIPYYDNCDNQNIGVKRLKTKVLMDSRIPGAIDN
ncbi:MAG: hypothetical protein J6J17_05440 [Bacilli bacterium]|nr:hypothetical protein [Bacilli bacterium]